MITESKSLRKTYDGGAGMIYQSVSLCSEHIPFVNRIFQQNNETLHGGQISLDEWYTYLCLEPDPYEMNFIITADGENAAWMKLNGLDNQNEIFISMLVVAKEYQRNGVGSFAVRFAEDYARARNKGIVRITTTMDNVIAVDFYLKQGYEVEERIRYAVGDGVIRDGYLFKKKIEVTE